MSSYSGSRVLRTQNARIEYIQPFSALASSLFGRCVDPRGGCMSYSVICAHGRSDGVQTSLVPRAAARFPIQYHLQINKIFKRVDAGAATVLRS